MLTAYSSIGLKIATECTEVAGPERANGIVPALVSPSLRPGHRRFRRPDTRAPDLQRFPGSGLSRKLEGVGVTERCARHERLLWTEPYCIAWGIGAGATRFVSAPGRNAPEGCRAGRAHLAHFTPRAVPAFIGSRPVGNRTRRNPEPGVMKIGGWDHA